MTSTEQLSVYVRQWHPSTLTLDLPKEVVLQDSVVEELKEEVRIIQIILHCIFHLVHRPFNPQTEKWRSSSCRLTLDIFCKVLLPDNKNLLLEQSSPK